jgi:hypothetical protein
MEKSTREDGIGRPSRVAEMYDLVVDYSGYSTFAGIIYVFMPGQPLGGKVYENSNTVEAAECDH